MAKASEAEKARMRARATKELLASGAHLVVDTIADLPKAITEIEARQEKGETPG